MAVSIPLLKRVVGPALPFTAAFAKEHTRIDHDAEDDMVEQYIKAAVDYIEGPKGYLAGTVFMAQTWEMALDAFPSSEIRIPVGPLVSVVSVNYTDDLGADQVVDSENYEIDDYDERGWVVPVEGFSWPLTIEAINAVKVRWTAGRGVSDMERQAILLLTSHFYTHRGDGDQPMPQMQWLLGRRRHSLVLA